MSETQFATSGTAQIAYDITGAEDPVVLIHAGLANRSMYDDQIESFSQKHKVIRVDLRGFGESKRPNELYLSWQDVVAVLDHAGIDKAHVLGTSMGSGVAADLAVAAPQRVRTLTLVGSNVGSDSPESLRKEWQHVDELYESEGVDAAVEYELKMWIDGPDRQPSDIEPAFRERVRTMNRELFLRTDTEGDETPFEPDISTISAPTLVIWGDKDMHHIRAAGPKLADAIPGARSVVIQNASHLPNMERPGEFNEIVLGFISGH